MKRIHHRTIVGAVTGRLHDDVAREAEVIAQGKELFLRGITRRVFARLRKGEFGRGPENVAMRIHRARRYLEAGF